MIKQSSLTGYTIVSKSPAAVWVSPARVATRIDAQPFLPDLVELDNFIGSRDDCVLLGSKLDRRRRISGGATPLGANYLTEGVRFIRTENVTPNWIELEDVVFISPVDHEQLRRSALQTDDVLLTITGALFGQSATVYSECLPANISQHSVRIALSPDLNPRFVSTYLNSRYGQAQIQIHKVGATRSAIDYEGVSAIKLPLSPRPVQEYIGAKVRLAERCRLRARELRDRVRLLLEQHANVLAVESASSKSKEHITYRVAPADVGDRMDPEFYQPHHVRTELALSAGRNRRLGDFVLAPIKGVQPEYAQSGTVPAITVTNIDPNLIDTDSALRVSQGWADTNPKAMPRPGDILMTVTGPPLGETAVVHPFHVPLVTNSHVARLRCKDRFPYPNYLASVLNSAIGSSQVYRFCKGIRQKELYPEDLLAFIVPELDLRFVQEIDELGKRADQLDHLARALVGQARADVEALIEGRLDADGIMAGQVRPPTWEEIEV